MPLGGWGPYSDTISILAGTVPQFINSPIISYINNGLNVKVEWLAPNKGCNGCSIISYKLLILQSDNTNFTEELTDCNGALLQIINQRYCTIPMRVLTSPPYNLPVGFLIIAKLKANNSIGWSLESPVNTIGVNAANIPTTPKNYYVKA